jgi:hypothetical protein
MTSDNFREADFKDRLGQPDSRKINGLGKIQVGKLN